MGPAPCRPCARQYWASPYATHAGRSLSSQLRPARGCSVALSNQSGAKYESKSDMTRRSIERLCHPRRGAVTMAVARRARVRAALGHATRYTRDITTIHAALLVSSARDLLAHAGRLRVDSGSSGRGHPRRDGQEGRVWPSAWRDDRSAVGAAEGRTEALRAAVVPASQPSTGSTTRPHALEIVGRSARLSR